MALLFTGGAYLTVPTTSTNLKITGDMGILVWIQTATTAVFNVFNAHDPTNPYPGYALGGGFITPGNHAYFNSLVGNWLSSNVACNDNVYHSIVVTKSGTDIAFYVDGATAGTASAGTPGVTLSLIGIAARGDGAGPLDGILSHLTVVNRTPTSTPITGEIARFHACEDPLTIFGANAVGCWKMASGALLTDSSANGYHASIGAGTPVFAADPAGYTAGPAGPASVYVIFEG